MHGPGPFGFDLICRRCGQHLMPNDTLARFPSAIKPVASLHTAPAFQHRFAISVPRIRVSSNQECHHLSSPLSQFFPRIGLSSKISLAALWAKYTFGACSPISFTISPERHRTHLRLERLPPSSNNTTRTPGSLLSTAPFRTPTWHPPSRHGPRVQATSYPGRSLCSTIDRPPGGGGCSAGGGDLEAADQLLSLGAHPQGARGTFSRRVHAHSLSKRYVRHCHNFGSRVCLCCQLLRAPTSRSGRRTTFTGRGFREDSPRRAPHAAEWTAVIQAITDSRANTVYLHKALKVIYRIGAGADKIQQMECKRREEQQEAAADKDVTALISSKEEFQGGALSGRPQV